MCFGPRSVCKHCKHRMEQVKGLADVTNEQELIICIICWAGVTAGREREQPSSIWRIWSSFGVKACLDALKKWYGDNGDDNQPYFPLINKKHVLIGSIRMWNSISGEDSGSPTAAHLALGQKKYCRELSSMGRKKLGWANRTFPYLISAILSSI